MKTLGKIMNTLALCALIFTADVNANQVITGEVIRVHDGDTITVKASNENINVRLARIDAPELKQPYGKQSGDWLRKIVKGKTVTVDIEDIDRYGRAVGTVMMGNENVNAIMVEDGYAWVYREFSKGGDDLMLLEIDARARRIGLWTLDNPIYPPDFRKHNK
jgi:endonuclease YncB( thermonuclease family)